jgi:hypothetical protein
MPPGGTEENREKLVRTEVSGTRAGDVCFFRLNYGIEKIMG